MLFVSHDRAFLRGLSNRVLELGGETRHDDEPHAYPGSYVEYVAAHRTRGAGRARVEAASCQLPAASSAKLPAASYAASSYELRGSAYRQSRCRARNAASISA